MDWFPGTLKAFSCWMRSERQCWRELRALRWPDGFICPQCKVPGEPWILRAERLLQCRACKHQASVIAGTIFQDTHLPLRMWFKAAWLVAQPEGGANASQFHKDIGLPSYATAWNLLRKLRHVMAGRGQKLHGDVDLCYAAIEIIGPNQGRSFSDGDVQIALAVECSRHGKPTGVRACRCNNRTAAKQFVLDTISAGSNIRTLAGQDYGFLDRNPPFNVAYRHRVESELVHRYKVAHRSRSRESESVREVALMDEVSDSLNRRFKQLLPGAVAGFQAFDYYLDKLAFQESNGVRRDPRPIPAREHTFFSLLKQALATPPVLRKA